MNDKKKMIATLLGVIAIVAIAFVGVKVFDSKTSIGSKDLNVDLSGFPSSVGQVYEGATVQYLSPWFHHKYTDKYTVICTEFRKTTPAANGHSCTLITSGDQWDEPTQAAIGAIVQEVTNKTYGIMKNLKNYYYGELAINQYFYETTKNSNNYIGDSAGSNAEVQRLVKLAKEAYNAAKSNFAISMSPATQTLLKNGNYYVTGVIKVSGSTDYSVSVSGISGAEVYDKNGGSFKVRVPASSISTGSKATLTIKATATKTYPVSAKYDCGGSYYQKVTPALTIDRKRTSTAQVTASVERTKLTIAKVDASNKYIAGAKLNVTGPNNYNKDFTSGTSPIVIEDLPYGTYTLTEKSAPAGYIKSTESKKLTLSATSLSVTGTITNIKTGFLVSKRSSTTGLEVAGATLRITDSNGNKKDEWVTTETKKVFNGYATGVYYLEEVKAPNGYKRYTGKIKFEIGSDGKINTSSGSATEVVMPNEPTSFKVSKRATNIEGEIPGAVLQIVDGNNKVVVKPWTTTSSKKVISMLPVGTYYLEELKAPAGYKRFTDKIKFTLSENGKVTTESGTVDEVTLTNDAIEATFSKTDIANSKELPGAELQILDKDGKEIKNSKGEVMYKWISTSKPHVISMIPAGKYYLVETQEPEGYVRKQEKVEFEIDEYGKILVGGKSVSKVTMTNEKTKVLISKQDVTNGKEIAGAELQIKDATGKVIHRWKSTNDPHMIEGLKVGKYYLTEKVAPKGYVLSEETIEFTIKNDGTVDVVVMLNTPIVKVPNTASAASIVIAIAGVIAVVFGGWMIFKNVKVKETN